MHEGDEEDDHSGTKTWTQATRKGRTCRPYVASADTRQRHLRIHEIIRSTKNSEMSRAEAAARADGTAAPL